MTSTIKVFGYGSLINIHSLLSTVPDAADIKPALLPGFRRVFETVSSTRFTDSNEPVSVLNITTCNHTSICGVLFTMSTDHFKELRERESSYELHTAEVTDFVSGAASSACVFIDESMDKQQFVHEAPTQLEYLDICLRGSKQFGREFYQNFLETTYIDDKPLVRHRTLTHLI